MVGVRAAPAEAPVAGAKLKAVQVVFRHGARTPLTNKFWHGTVWDVCGSAFPQPALRVTDAHSGAARPDSIDSELIHYEGGCTRGELTMLGQMQALELGQWLAQRYRHHISLLPANYDPQTVSSRTTNYRRTRATLAAVLKGLFPGQTEPFDAQTGGAHTDILLPQVNRCPPLAALFLAVKQAVKEKAETDEQMLADAAHIRGRIGGEPGRKALQWTELHDALTSMRSHNKSIPEALQSHDLDTVNKWATDKLTQILSSSEDTLRLSTGPLVHALRSALHAAAAAPPGTVAAPKMQLYSGHDTTLMPLAKLLGAQIARWPPYCSHVVLELWEGPEGRGDSVNDRHYVRVIYNGTPVPQGQEVAAGTATLAEFDARVLDRYALDAAAFELQCAATKTANESMVDTSSI